MLSVSRPKLSYLASAACVLLALTGCTGRLIPPSANQNISLHMQGKIHGGQQPVVGATIQLYDISSAYGGSPGATPLIGTNVTSDVNGGFNITGDYTCPNANDQVYLAAVGGDAGSGLNSDLVMMTALGNCGSLTASSYIWVNEVTTVATVFAYADDWDSGQITGANITELYDGNEYGNFLSLVDPTTGVALATNGSGVQLQINALANTLSVCINSSTDINGDSPACDNLITIAAAGNSGTASNDSAQAMWVIAENPNYDPMDEYNDAPPSPPFQPTLTSAPQGWNLGIVPGNGCVKQGAPESRVVRRSAHPRC